MVWCSVIQLTTMCIVKEPSVIQQVDVLCALISFSVCLFVVVFFLRFGICLSYTILYIP